MSRARVFHNFETSVEKDLLPNVLVLYLGTQSKYWELNRRVQWLKWSKNMHLMPWKLKVGFYIWLFSELVTRGETQEFVLCVLNFWRWWLIRCISCFGMQPPCSYFIITSDVQNLVYTNTKKITKLKINLCKSLWY